MEIDDHEYQIVERSDGRFQAQMRIPTGEWRPCRPHDAWRVSLDMARFDIEYTKDPIHRLPKIVKIHPYVP